MVRALISITTLVFSLTASAGAFTDANPGGEYRGSYNHGDGAKSGNDVFNRSNYIYEKREIEARKEANEIVAAYRKDVAGKGIANQDPDLVLAEAQRFVRLTAPPFQDDGPGKRSDKDTCAPSASEGYTMVCTIYASNMKSKTWVPSVYLFKHLTTGSIKGRVNVSNTAVAVKGAGSNPSPTQNAANTGTTATPTTSLTLQSLWPAGKADFCYGVECFASWGGGGRTPASVSPASVGFAIPAKASK